MFEHVASAGTEDGSVDSLPHNISQQDARAKMNFRHLQMHLMSGHAKLDAFRYTSGRPFFFGALECCRETLLHSAVTFLHRSTAELVQTHKTCSISHMLVVHL